MDPISTRRDVAVVVAVVVGLNVSTMRSLESLDVCCFSSLLCCATTLFGVATVRGTGPVLRFVRGVGKSTVSQARSDSGFPWSLIAGDGRGGLRGVTVQFRPAFCAQVASLSSFCLC